MTIITKQSQIAEATTADLIETYNALSGKTIPRFSSRAAGEAQVANAILSAESRDAKSGVQKGSKPVARPAKEAAAKEAARSSGQATPSASGDRGSSAQPAKAARKSGQPRPLPALKKMAAQVTKKPEAPSSPAKKTKGSGDASMSIQKTWNDAEVRAARSLKQRVMVDGTEYRSVREAFTALKLPDSKHVKFRMELKAAGTGTFEGLSGIKHKFKIVEAA